MTPTTSRSSSFATHSQGELTTDNDVAGGPDADEVLEARFLSRREMEDQTVYPQVLKDAFWDDLQDGFPAVSHLGMQYG